MKNLLRLIFLSVVIFSLFSKAEAIPVRLASGELFIGGSAFGTPGYQNYLRFYIVGKIRVPQRSYIMQAEQRDAVYLNHPVRPEGDYDYRVGMPHHGGVFGVNDDYFFPVWYDCVWNIQSSVQTPVATADSPQFTFVNAPFTMDGSSNFLGAYSIGFRIKGQGVSELRFEKIGTKYYVREARYIFTINAPNQVPLK